MKVGINFMKSTVKTIKANISKAPVTLKMVLSNKRGEGALDIVIPILVSIVLAALILAGLYTLFGSTVLPTITQKIQNMFNYN